MGEFQGDNGSTAQWAWVSGASCLCTLLQEFETELKTATDDAAEDAAKTLEDKKEELR